MNEEFNFPYIYGNTKFFNFDRFNHYHIYIQRTEYDGSLEEGYELIVTVNNLHVRARVEIFDFKKDESNIIEMKMDNEELLIEYNKIDKALRTKNFLEVKDYLPNLEKYYEELNDLKSRAEVFLKNYNNIIVEINKLDTEMISIVKEYNIIVDNLKVVSIDKVEELIFSSSDNIPNEDKASIYKLKELRKKYNDIRIVVKQIQNKRDFFKTEYDNVIKKHNLLYDKYKNEIEENLVKLGKIILSKIQKNNKEIDYIINHREITTKKYGIQANKNLEDFEDYKEILRKAWEQLKEDTEKNYIAEAEGRDNVTYTEIEKKIDNETNFLFSYKISLIHHYKDMRRHIVGDTGKPKTTTKVVLDGVETEDLLILSSFLGNITNATKHYKENIKKEVLLEKANFIINTRINNIIQNESKIINEINDFYDKITNNNISKLIAEAEDLIHNAKKSINNITSKIFKSLFKR